MRFLGFSGCAVPGEQVRRIPPQTFDELRRTFAEASFFGIPRRDAGRTVTDTDVVTIAYRDDRRVHEVIDTGRRGAKVDQLRERFRQATRLVDTFINPRVEEYRRLLAGGWDVNTKGNDGENALTAAAARDPGAARFLLERGATASRGALGHAALTGDVELVRSMMAARRVEPNSDEAQQLLVDAAGRSTAVMSLLLDSGTNPNATAGNDRTPLAAAVSSGSGERVRLLLSRGADPRRTPTIMLTAVSQEDTGIITLLARHGADVNEQDTGGRTALIKASDLCRWWHIEALLAAGADPLIATRDGRTALQPQTALSTPTESCRKSEAIVKAAAARRSAAR
jgi:ankyrin repeat protein